MATSAISSRFRPSRRVPLRPPAPRPRLCPSEPCLLVPAAASPVFLLNAAASNLLRAPSPATAITSPTPLLLLLDHLGATRECHGLHREPWNRQDHTDARTTTH
ncbi:hypothetical protein VPH35_059994 [Triticum aestivum]